VHVHQVEEVGKLSLSSDVLIELPRALADNSCMKIARFHHGHSSSRLGYWPGRLLSVVGLVAFFLATSSIFIPDGSRGDRGLRGGGDSTFTVIEGNGEDGRDILFTPVEGDLAVIGELVCRSHRIRILASHPEPLYTILDLDGRVVASRLTASAVALRFPDLPLLRPFEGMGSDSFSEGGVDESRAGEIPLMSDVPMDDHE